MKTNPHAFQQRLARITVTLTAVSLAFSSQGRAGWSKKMFDLLVYVSIAIGKMFSMFFSLHSPDKSMRSIFL